MENQRVDACNIQSDQYELLKKDLNDPVEITETKYMKVYAYVFTNGLHN